MEGDPVTGNPVSPYHGAGAGDGKIDLRDPDTGTTIVNFSGATFTFGRFSTTFATKATTPNTNAIDYIIQRNFCLKCHDANGANSAAARVTGGTNVRPFGNLTAVRNVFGWFSSAGPRGSRHPVVRVSTQTPSYALNKMAAPYNTTHKVMVCWDCHNTVSGALATIRTVDAHGSGSARTLMRGGTAFWRTGAVSSTNNTTFCIICHTGYSTGTATNHAPNSAWTSTGADSGMNNYIRYACYYCHGSGPNALTAQSRQTRSQDMHGFNKLPNGNNWSDGSPPYAFIRSSGYWNNATAYRHKVLSGPGVVTGSATCTGFNGTNGTTSCNRGSMGTYTPGGAY